MTTREVTKQKILGLVDRCSENGILTLSVLRQNNVRLTDEVISAINELVATGVLSQRDSHDFSVERTGNPLGKWGEQKNFNQYIHLTAQQLKDAIAEERNRHGLKIVILNDIDSCINSRFVDSEAEGIDYFNRTYEGKYSYHFVYC